MLDWAYAEAILLGILQGIAEFLPISSSGHLVIAGALLRQWTGRTVSPEASLQMNLALHVGSLFSILWIYRQELMTLAGRPRVCLAIAVATLPLVVVGLTPAKDWLDEIFSTPLVAGCGLLVTAVLLAVGQRLGRDSGSLDLLRPAGALGIGLFQMVAILPGISRSGSTIAGGLIVGLRREDAATFSFLIAIPAIAGAAVLLGAGLADKSQGDQPISVLALGAIVSFAVGLVALRWLLRLVSQRKLHWFAWYCAALGTATIAWQLAG